MLQTLYDVEKIRRDFPIFQNNDRSSSLVFLDTAASAQKPEMVLSAMNNFYTRHYANVHRGIYKLSQDATQMYENARSIVARCLNAAKTHECIFTRNTTEGINLVAQSYGRTFFREGDEVILTTLEHHSNIVPWQLLRDQTGIVIREAVVTDRGEIDLNYFKNLFTQKTKLAAFVHVSNAIGTVLPVREMTRIAHEAGALVLIDGSQAVPHMKVDVQALDADFYVCTGHKVYGPTGIGVLYAREQLLDSMPPYQGGGDMISVVTFPKTTYNSLPYKFEAGTPNIAGAIGLGAAINYIAGIGYEAIGAHESALLAEATDALSRFERLRLIGQAQEKASILSFVLEGIHSHDAGTIFDQLGLVVRTGHHCTQPLMQRFNLVSTIRASFGLYNTKEDVARLAEGIEKTLDIFS